MSLFNVEDKLYKKEEEENLSEHEISQYNPSASEIGKSNSKEDDLWLEKKKGFDSSEKKKITTGLLALIIILFIIFVMAVAFEIRQVAFNVKNASVAISGSVTASSGQIVTYEVSYKNKNWVGMSGATVKFSYPEEFKPELNGNFKEIDPTSGIYTIGNVGARASGKISFSGRSYSPKGALIYLKATLAYQPSFFFGNFETGSQLGINVVPAPITLEIEGPQDMVSGNAVDYLINYRNDGAETLQGLQIQTQYPEGFIFSRANPPESQANNVWAVGNLKPGESGKLVVSGQLEGSTGMNRTATVSIGVLNNGKFVSYNDERLDTRMVSSPLTITQTVNGKQQTSVNAGEHLQFKIKYKNNGNIGLRDVIVTEKLDSPVLNYASLEMKGARFDIADKLITWKASDIQAFNNLAPGASGEIDFSIEVKENIPLDTDIKKNFTVTSLAKIDSPDIATPISRNKIIFSNRLDMKLNSKIILEAKGFFNDETIPNSGPIPPRVGQETTYTLHWKALNVSNDINGVIVTASLPTNTTMTGRISPEDARLSYNERTNLIIWNIGDMDAGEGVLNAAPQVAFQVKITPSINQVGKEVGLLEEATFSAKDLFTNEALLTKAEAKTTNLVEDKNIQSIGGNRVVN